LEVSALDEIVTASCTHRVLIHDADFNLVKGLAAFSVRAFREEREAEAGCERVRMRWAAFEFGDSHVPGCVKGRGDNNKLDARNKMGASMKMVHTKR